MKTTKKLFAVIMALALVLSLGVSAFAANDGTISVSGSAGQTYNVYRLLDMENSEVTDAFRYYLAADDVRLPLFGTLSGDTFTPDASNGAADLFDFSVENGRVYVSAKDTIQNDNATLKSFSEAALAFVEANSIAAAGTAVAGDSGSASFAGLPYGYYLVDSSAGALCMLNTVNSAARITEKNEVPVVTKTATLPEGTNPKIGTTVTYTIRIVVKPGAENYVLHDMMTAGLTFNDDVSVQMDGADVPAANYTLTKNVAHDLDEDGTTDETHTFDIVFEDDYVRANSGKTIVVTYTATINPDAITAGAGNGAGLSYGDHNSVTLDPAGEDPVDPTPNDPDPVVLEFHFVQIVNVDKADGTILPDGTYQLLNSDSPVALIADGENLRPALASESGSTTFTAGDKKIIGLGQGNYKLKEVTAPNGYNPVEDPIAFTISDSDLKVDDGAISGGVLSASGHGSAIVFEHGAGALFPTTGMTSAVTLGTISAVLVMTAVLLFVCTKRKESKANA